MPLPVSLRDVADELDALSQGMIAYCNRKTGEVTSLTEEMLAAAEGEDDLSGFDDDMLADLRDIVSSEDWVALPDKFEIHEWEILRDFVDQVEDGPIREELQRAIHGSGAFRRFKEVVRGMGSRSPGTTSSGAPWRRSPGKPSRRPGFRTSRVVRPKTSALRYRLRLRDRLSPR